LYDSDALDTLVT